MNQNDKIKNNVANDVETAIARILAIGIYMSSAFFITGLLLLFIRHEQVENTHFYFDSIRDFLEGFIKLDAKPFLYTGTAALILTPISRVVLSIIQFWKFKERKFALITLIVAIIIVISISMGFIFSLKLG